MSEPISLRARRAAERADDPSPVTPASSDATKHAAADDGRPRREPASRAGRAPAASSTRVEGGDEQSHPSGAKVWRDRLILVAVVWAVWAFITTFVIQPFRIPSSSMENTLQIGDRIVVSKWVPRFSDVKRGDVIVFKDPGDWTDPVPNGNAVLAGIRKVAEVTHLSASGSHLVKRVVGVAGDKVSCDGAGTKLKVNGVAINETYLKPGVQPCQDKFAITVPAEKVWVMGDNRSDSADSRYHDDGTGALGSVPVSKITGRDLAVVWPISNISGGHNDEDAFAKVPAAK